MGRGNIGYKAEANNLLKSSQTRRFPSSPPPSRHWIRRPTSPAWSIPTPPILARSWVSKSPSVAHTNQHLMIGRGAHNLAIVECRQIAPSPCIVGLIERQQVRIDA